MADLKDITINSRLIDARDETIGTKSNSRDAFAGILNAYDYKLLRLDKTTGTVYTIDENFARIYHYGTPTGIKQKRVRTSFG